MLLRINIDKKPELVQLGQFQHGLLGRPETFYTQKLWCLHLYEYRARLDFRNESFDIQPGHLSILPTGEKYTYTYEGPSTHLYAHFLPAAGNSRSTIPINVMRPLGACYPQIREKIEHMIRLFPINRRHADVLLWDILWDLVEMERKDAPPAQQALELAILYIEQHLHEPLSVTSVVRNVPVSQNTLLNLFQQKFSKSIAAYIRDRRMQRARNLLLHTTLPIKAIAVDCGLPDLQQFNKTVRLAFGAPPRALRRKIKSKLDELPAPRQPAT